MAPSSQDLMDTINALGPNPERRRAFTRELLAETDDAALQKLVKQAARELNTPIALVSLVLDGIQFFKAHYGLPEDLKAARGTNRDVSFCQFVVRDGQPFEVNNASQDPRVPQHLVQEYGLHAYLGMPLRVGDVVIGSLCVMDHKERSFSGKERKSLEHLAALVNRRVQELAERRQRTRLAMTDEVAAPAIAELSESLKPILNAAAEGLQAAVAIRAFLRLSAYSLRGGSTSPQALRQTLEAAAQAFETTEDLLYDIEAAAEDCADCILALEYLANPGRTPRLSEVLASAQDLARRNTRQVGGVILPELSFDPLISAPQPLAVALVTTALNRLAAQMGQAGVSSGIRVQLQKTENKAQLRLICQSLAPGAISAITSGLDQNVADDPGIRVSAQENCLVLTFATVVPDPTIPPT